MTSWLFCIGTDGTERNDERISSDLALPPSSYEHPKSLQSVGKRETTYFRFYAEIARS